jgi:hypothetical protein
MGASFFESIGWVSQQKGHEYSGSDIRPAFERAVKEADEYYGHQEGYSGNINSKNGFCMGGVMTRNQFDRVHDLWRGDRVKLKKSVDKLPNASYSCLSSCEDKWGPSCAVVMKDEKRKSSVNVPKTVTFEKVTSKKPIKLDYTRSGRKFENSESFETVTEAKKRARELHKENAVINRFARETHSYKIDQIYGKKEINMVKVKFFGMAPS